MSNLGWPDIFKQQLHLKAAEGATNLQQLAANLSKLTNRTITYDALQGAAKRHDQPPPTTWLGADCTASPIESAPDTTAPAPRLLELDRAKKKATATAGELRAVLEELAITKEQLATMLELDGATLDPRPIEPHPFAERQATAVALASDWHIEERVNAGTVNGRNEYSVAIAEQRVAKFFRGIRWLITHHRHSFSIDRLVLWLGGDLLTGYIHEELEESNELSPTQAILWLAEHIIAGIDSLLEIDLHLVVPCSYGNHGRTTKKRRISTGAANSYEWLLYKFLERHYAGHEAVEFHVAGGDHIYLDVYDHTLRFTHGDNFKYGGGVGGLSIPLMRGVTRLENFRHADITNLGHFHQLKDFGDAVVNGSLIGYSPYALSINAPFEPAQQAFYLVEPTRGKCMFTPIWVAD